MSLAPTESLVRLAPLRAIRVWLENIKTTTRLVRIVVWDSGVPRVLPSAPPYSSLTGRTEMLWIISFPKTRTWSKKLGRTATSVQRTEIKKKIQICIRT